MVWLWQAVVIWMRFIFFLTNWFRITEGRMPASDQQIVDVGNVADDTYLTVVEEPYDVKPQNE